MRKYKKTRHYKERVQQMNRNIPIAIAFKFFNIKIDWKEISQKTVLQTRLTVNIELARTYRHFKFKLMSPFCKSISMLKLIKSRYERGNLIRKMTMKIF